jgi:2-phospho-L-lactate/phosphoenolpyruvate guanylyltransferase
MRTLAILPIKQFGVAKGRLAGALGGGSRQALAQAMFSDVLSSLRRVPGIQAVLVVTADRVAESLAYADRVRVVHDSEQAGQSAATLIGVRHALALNYERVLLVPGDTPLLDADELQDLLERAELEGRAATIVPDRHGSGTNALLLSPPDALEPSFGPGSLERHMAAARAGGIVNSLEQLPSLALDVDEPEDLEELAGRLEGERGRAAVTRGTLRQLDRLRMSARAPVEAPV